MRVISRRLMSALVVAGGMASAASAQTPPAQPTPPALQFPSPATTATPATIPASAPQAAPCASVTPGLSDAPAMLGHIEDVLNDALGRTPTAEAALRKAHDKPIGTTGGASILVGIERDKLDQIRAEIAQLKVILKK